jgi:coatomer subunit beta'
VAEEALKRANDLSGLLLLHSSSGDAEGLRKLCEAAGKAGKFNIAFMAHFLLGEVDRCIDILVFTDRIPEAAFMARTYLPR